MNDDDLLPTKPEPKALVRALVMRVAERFRMEEGPRATEMMGEWGPTVIRMTLAELASMGMQVTVTDILVKAMAEELP